MQIDTVAKVQNVSGSWDYVPSLLTLLANAGIDTTNDFVLVYDASAGGFKKTVVGELFLAAGYAPAVAGAFDNVVIGGVTPLAGTFTTLDATTATVTTDNVTTSNITTANVTTLNVTNELVSTGTLAVNGTTQASTAVVSKTFTIVTGADDTAAIKLPTAVAGRRLVIKNTVANKALILFPSASDAINAIAADSPYTIAAGATVELIAYDATTWYTLPLVAS